MRTSEEIRKIVTDIVKKYNESGKEVEDYKRLSYYIFSRKSVNNFYLELMDNNIVINESVAMSRIDSLVYDTVKHEYELRMKGRTL